MEIRVYGGISEIGGNMIFLREGECSLLFDFGLSFEKNAEFYTSYLKPRSLNGIGDLLMLNLIPPIQGIYREDYIKKFNQFFPHYKNLIKPAAPHVSAAFLSHAHMDHYRYFYLLHKDIPLFMSLSTYLIIENHALHNLTVPYYKDLIRYSDITSDTKVRISYTSIDSTTDASSGEDPFIKRPIYLLSNHKTVFFNKKGKISQEGPLSVSSLYNDHSTIGSFSYIVESDGRSVLYTGDFRFHGWRYDPDNSLSHSFQEYLLKRNISTIIVEGTRVTPERLDSTTLSSSLSEEDVYNKTLSLIKNHDGAIFVNFSPTNLDRLYSFYMIAKKTHRILLLPPKVYFLLYSLNRRYGLLSNPQDYEHELFRFRSSESPLPYEENSPEFDKDYLSFIHLPPITSENIALYLPRAGSGNYYKKDYNRKAIRMFFKEENELTIPSSYYIAQSIKDHLSDFIFYLDLPMIAELIDLDLRSSSSSIAPLYIHSLTDAFMEEMEIRDKVFENWLNHFGVKRVESIHSSGHIHPQSLIKFLEKLSPDKIIPVHTEHPEAFFSFGLNSEIILPSYSNKILL